MNNLYKVSEVKLTYETNNKNKTKVRASTSAKMYALMLKHWEQIEYRESFKILLLDVSKQVLGINTVSMGGISGTVVDVRMILQSALLANASLIVACHNHPSGSIRPSYDDDVVTMRIREAAKIIDIKLVDHLIISKDGYYSYKDAGKMV